MTARIRGTKGFTLVEAMMVLLVVGVVSSLGASLLIRLNQFSSQSTARVEIQRDLRVILDDMDRQIRQASAATITVTENAGQPPYSKISFVNVEGSSVTYSQSGRTLTQTVGRDNVVLTKNLQYLAFSYPQTDVNTVVAVSLTLQKATYAGHTTSLQMALTKVRVMNP